MTPLFIITGPTGIGKSYFGHRLALEKEFPILSIDSMLVYKSLNIGTAKPSKEELEEVHHYCVSNVDDHENYDMAKFVNDANAAIQKHNGDLIGVGGTPFYIKALTQGFEKVETLDGLESKLGVLETDEAYRWLQKLDSTRAEKLHSNDRFRILRALTIILSTGQKASSFAPPDPNEQLSKHTIIALNADRKLMHQRIEQRVDQMLAQGLEAEAKNLFENDTPLSKTAAAGVGYKEMFSYFRGELSLEEAREKIIVATRRLLKHQMTWLRKWPVTWIDVNFDEPDQTFDRLKELLDSHLKNKNS